MSRRTKRRTLAPSGWLFGFLALALLAAVPAFAGTLCGIVRDGQTLLPVDRAAVFLYDNLDQYTGLYAGTDPAGQYCIDNIPNGTYTLQVRVNDYVAAVVRDIVVDNATSVDVRTRTPLFLAGPHPNPATNTITFEFGSPGGAATTLEVYDVSGRLVMGWNGAGSGDNSIRWDLKDPNGSPIASGIYLVRLRAGGNEAVRRFVRLR
jgi:hypothetical protein